MVLKYMYPSSNLITSSKGLTYEREIDTTMSYTDQYAHLEREGITFQTTSQKIPYPVLPVRQHT